MKIISDAEVKIKLNEIKEKILKGSIFIHPTDTIYGISCDATNEKSVRKIREIKNRPEAPLSIWVPSLKWVEENCELNDAATSALSKLPGPYTLIIPLKNKDAVAKSVTNGKNTIGIRFPEHWCSDLVKEVGVPIITTSVNKSNQPHMTRIENLDPDIKSTVDFCIYEGEKDGKPSKIINTVTNEVKKR